jgi:radical SAM superfamily enzyme YgiQ (UPF0313 family)
VLTPFPKTKVYDDMLRQGRIFDHDWSHYNAGKVVYKPKHMTPERLQELYDYAWESFYRDEPQTQKMFKLFSKVMLREMNDNTFRPRQRELINLSFGKEINRAI